SGAACAHEQHAAFRVSLNPTHEVFYYGLRIVKAQSILAREPRHRESVRTPIRCDPTPPERAQHQSKSCCSPLVSGHRTPRPPYIWHRAYSETPTETCSCCVPIGGNMGSSQPAQENARPVSQVAPPGVMQRGNSL